MARWASRSGLLRIPLAVVLGVGVLLCLFILVLMVRRRHRLIIKERTFPLLVISCVGNMAGLTCIALDGILEGGNGLSSWYLYYLTLFFEYVYFGPYILRIYHIKIVYYDFLDHFSRYQQYEHRLHFHWYWRFLVLGLLPFFALPGLLGLLNVSGGIGDCSYECRMLLMHISWEVVDFVEVMSLLISIYYLRHMDDHLNITQELLIVCLATTVQSFADNYQDNEAIYLIQSLRDLTVLLVSNVLPVCKSYDDRYEIWLTPDVIESFDFSMTNLDSLLAFRQFLQSVPLNSSFTSSVSILTGPRDTQSADAYMWFFLAVLELEKKPTFVKAERIKDTYFHAQQRLFPRGLTQGVEESINRKVFQGEESELAEVFAGAREFALERLRLKYFPMYMKSARFKKLKREVERFLRLKNREEYSRERQDTR